MAEIKTMILDALNDLLEKEFKEFRWHLSNDSSIPRSKLEHADQHDVVDLMVQHFSSVDAGTKAVQVLRKIKQNDCADRLQNKLVSGDVSAASSRGAVNAAPTSGVSVNISASSGGTIKAPVVQGAVFNGPVTFN